MLTLTAAAAWDAAASAAGPPGFAAALLDPRHAPPPGLKAWNGSDPGARFAVHRNNGVASLVDVLADTLPVVRHLVGADVFAAMAAHFVRRSPPRSPVLAHYGDGFAAFLDEIEPPRGLACLADLARLERARVAACHAADAEPVPGATVRAALASGDRIGALRLVLHPSVRALGSRHAVASLWAAHQVDPRPADADVAALARDGPPEDALVLRSGLDVLVLRAPAGTACFVVAIGNGVGLADAVARAIDAAPAFDLAAALTPMLAHGALTSLSLPHGDPA